jgi:uncharacterized membrane protein YfcA
VTGLEELAVVATGFVAGIMTSTVGVASLLSFPVLLALGLPPVVANASNTIGMTPASLTGSFGYRAELRAHPVVTTTIIGTCASGSVLGAVLLLALPPGVFEAIVPWLILGTCLLVGAQPRISRWLRRTHEAAPPDGRTRLSPVTTFFSTVVGVYGGYFGAGSGVMMMAVLGLGSNLEFRIVNALKTLAILASNLVASVIFVVVADLDWLAIVLLASGSIVGGYVGSRIGRRLNPTVLRTLIVLVGVIAALTMLL